MKDEPWNDERWMMSDEWWAMNLWNDERWTMNDEPWNDEVWTMNDEGWTIKMLNFELGEMLNFKCWILNEKILKIKECWTLGNVEF